MANQPEYICTGCEQMFDREELTVKKAVFLEMGVGARTKRSRVVAWLCPGCLRKDGQYTLPAFQPRRVSVSG